MKKLSREELIATFLAEYPQASFSKIHQDIIGSLLTKRDFLGKLPIAEKIDLVSQEQTTLRHACSIELSKQEASRATVKITSPDGVDTLSIKTELSVEKIAEVLRKSNGLDNFVVRINTQAKKEATNPEATRLTDLTRLWVRGL